MKTQIKTRSDRQALGRPLLAILLLAAWASRADSPYSSTGWVNAVFAPGIVCTNGAGQVSIHANVHHAQVQSSDTRLTGSRLILCDGAYNADGSASLQGSCYQQVGTWDAYGTNFTATGGTWDISYQGVMQTDYSLQLSLVGYGIGGAIDGQRIVETLTRGPAAGPIDPAVPYIYSGTIKPAPVNTSQVVDDFNHPFAGQFWGSGTCLNSGGQFRAIGSFSVPTDSIFDSYVFGGNGTAWTVPNGQTREWRADLVSLDENATNTAILGVGTSTGAGYAFHKGRDFAYLLKWSSSFAMSVLWCERPAVPLPHSNVVLTLSLTRLTTNYVITTRVLDKANPSTVLFQHSTMDTPGRDATLSPTQFQALTGITFLDLVPDAAEPPPASVGAVLGVFQYTDGHEPVPTAVWDNLELRTYEVPAVGIQPAMQLTWLAPAGVNYAVEAAPTPQGPWQPLSVPVTDSEIPGMKQASVPSNGTSQFYRLVQVP